MVSLSRFDKVVILSLLSMVFATAFMVWRGDRVGVQIVSVTPPERATGISTATDIRVIFDQPMAPNQAGAPLTLSPPVSGTARWQGAELIFSPDTPLAPDTTYTVTLANHLTSQRGRTLLNESRWQFTTGQAQLLYIAPDAASTDQLFLIDPFDPASTPAQLTREALGVFDYDLSFDGATIVYAALREDGGSDLWTVTISGGPPSLLLECPESVCNGAAWMPDNRRLIYERRVMLVPGAAPGPPRLWWLDTVTGETVIVFEDNQLIGYGASWSPDGQWLSYVAPSSQGLQLYNINDGRSLVIPSRMGGLAVWGPYSDALVVTDIQRTEEGFAVHLLRAAPDSGELVDISGQGATVEDSTPVWSPNGEWLALTRKTAGTAMGKQLWLMRPDGSEAFPLTDDPEIHHGAPAWSPDGRYLAYQRFPLKELSAQPSLWLLEVETQTAGEVVTPGNRPTWLP